MLYARRAFFLLPFLSLFFFSHIGICANSFNSPDDKQRSALIRSVIAKHGKTIDDALVKRLLTQTATYEPFLLETAIDCIAGFMKGNVFDEILCDTVVKTLEVACKEFANNEHASSSGQFPITTIVTPHKKKRTAKKTYPLFSDLFYSQDTLELFEKVVKKLRRGLQLADPHCMILYGPSGTGKSSAAKAIANEAGYAFISLVAAEAVTKYQGSGPATIKNIFSKAQNLGKPVVLFIDEVQALISSKNSPTKDYDNALTMLWTLLDDCKENYPKVFIIMACNEYETLDIRLRNRVRLSLKIPLPEYAARKAILNLTAQRFGKEISDDLCSKYAGYWWTAKWSGRDLSTMVEDAVSDSQGPVIDEKALRYYYDKKVAAKSDAKKDYSKALEWCKEHGSQTVFTTLISALVYKVINGSAPVTSLQDAFKSLSASGNSSE